MTTDAPDLFTDVYDFHRKFDLPHPDHPVLLNWDDFMFRFRFMSEELGEMIDAQEEEDIAGIADGLADVIYVALGTAVMMGLPFDRIWQAVHDANMRKVRADHADDTRSVRKHKLDVVKPEGWKAPDVEGIIKRAME
jgi:predicted HAD superfamily Cof-like phosphohydrolase